MVCMKTVQKVMRMLAQYEHKAFKVATLHSCMQHMHAAIKSTSFGLMELQNFDNSTIGSYPNQSNSITAQTVAIFPCTLIELLAAYRRYHKKNLCVKLCVYHLIA